MIKTTGKTRLIAFILSISALAAVLIISSCSPGGNGAQTQSTEKVPDAPATVTGWFDYGTALYLRDKFTPGTKQKISFQMAKNEKEGFEYVVVSDGDVDGLRCEVSPLSDGNGHALNGTVYVAWQINVRRPDLSHKKGYTPDPLLEQDNPYQGGSFDLKSGRAKTLYVQYATDINTAPGTYTGVLEIKRGGQTLLSGDVSVTVRDVYYDEKTESKDLFQYGYSKYDPGFGGPGPDSAPNMDTGHYNQFAGVETDVAAVCNLLQQYADFMLDNRLSPWHLPLKDELLDDPALVSKYMDNPRQTLVVLNNSDTFDEQKKVIEEKGWADKICAYCGDEPVNEQMFNNFRNIALSTGSRLGTTKFLCAFGVMYVQELLAFDPPIIERLGEFTTLHCPDVYTAFGHQPTRDYMYKLRRERGDTLLWYDAGPAYGDYVNRPHILTCQSGLEKRIIYWQQYLLDFDGFLYFHTTKWNMYLDFWARDYEDAETPLLKPTEPYEGGGVLMYWDPVTGAPVGSLSLESIRDGIEDFQLMKMAERAVGRAAVLEYVNKVTTGHTEFTSDGDVLEQARAALFDIVESGAAR
ncbi:MAG: DUF4091 domain-containing protein [Clostridia bacterium]|nr:DUF4091 domain-containing protein [Clostridia bacterium]